MLTQEVDRQEITCPCKDKRIRYKMSEAGSKLFYLQCQNCGRATRLSKDKVANPNSLQIEPVNQKLIEAWSKKITDFYARFHEQKQIEWQTQKQQEREEWFKWYNAYLGTNAWRIKREAVLERDNYTCQGCLKNKATQVHHLTYDRAGQEMLFDLISVCTQCHNLIHDLK